ncbi:MAG: FAD-binding oxidoreductase [Chloroflexota bacterium]
MVLAKRTAFLVDLESAIGEDRVITDPPAIEAMLRDNSWLSPILTEHFGQMKQATGGSFDVAAIAMPRDVPQLQQCIAVAVRHNVPMTLRGGGSSNFGQSVPLAGGLVIDIRSINRILDIRDDRVTVEAGALQGEVSRAVKARGRELTILTTTYAISTAAGWVAGGHVGIGANTRGTIWDGNVLGVKLLTAEENPREIELNGDQALYPVLHAYGTTGVITQVTFPLVPAREWVEVAVAFESFDPACAMVRQLAEESTVPHLVATAQEAPIPTSFAPMKDYFRDHQSAVMAIISADHVAACEQIAAALGGRLRIWRRESENRKCPMAYMVYGHRMLWVKKIAPSAAFLHCYFKPDAVGEQVRAIKDRFGDQIWFEMKYIKSRWLRMLRGLEGEGSLPAPVLTVVSGDRAVLQSLMNFCGEIGVTYQNPHTFVLEESGLFPDFAPILEFKQRTDPKGLLNPGKIGSQFFSRPASSTNSPATASTGS